MYTKGKEWLQNFFVILLILILVFGGQYVLEDMREKAASTYQINIYLHGFITFFFYGGIGVLLGLEHFIREKKKDGKWSLNRPKLVLIGIPSLYFSASILLFYNSILSNTFLTYPIGVLLNNNGSHFLTVFNVIFGYTIITSFYKKKINNENNK
jgi:uncharacterized membrane protein